MAQYATVRDYDLTYYDTNNPPYITMDAHSSLDKYAAIPTPEEANNAFGVTGVDVRYVSLFYNERAHAYPRIPEGGSSYTYMFQMSNILIAPMLPISTDSYTYWFEDADLINPPVLPKGTRRIGHMFANCPMPWPVSIPKTVTSMAEAFYGCNKMKGEMIVRPTSISSSLRADVFKNTQKAITLYGDQTLCGYLAATANNGNVSWSPWYDPVPAVTNRGQGSKTTAADMTRMVRNGALAVDTYAPGRMVYQQGDIVREDEWIALVDAAKTIDPTITLSTNYMNLNKIEAAFESAL